MANKYDDADGVWRTVGGRRIFIKDGQSLSNAMKKSNKFKGKRKKTVKQEEKKDDFLDKYSYKEGDNTADLEDKQYALAEEMDKMTDEGRDNGPEFEKMEQQYDKLQEMIDSGDYDEVDKQLTKQEENEKTIQRANEYLENGRYANEAEKEKIQAVKNQAERNLKKEDYSDYDYPEEITTKEQWKQDYGNNIEELERDLKNSEMYLGEPEDEGYKEGKKSLENGYEYLNELKSQQNKYDEYYKKEKLGKPSNYKKGDQIEFKSGYNETVKGTIVREATDKDKEFQINKNLKGYVVKTQNENEVVVADTKIKVGNTSREEAKQQIESSKLKYKSAFDEYKKKHPNTKLNLNDFIKIAEGK